jgi:hypothetical protein
MVLRKMQQQKMTQEKRRKKESVEETTVLNSLQQKNAKTAAVPFIIELQKVSKTGVSFDGSFIYSYMKRIEPKPYKIG